MTKKIEPKEIAKTHKPFRPASKADVDLRDKPGMPGNFWCAGAAGEYEGVTFEFLAENQCAVKWTANRGGRRPFEKQQANQASRLEILLLAHVPASTGESLEMAGDILAFMHMTDESRAPASSVGGADALRISGCHPAE